MPAYAHYRLTPPLPSPKFPGLKVIFTEKPFITKYCQKQIAESFGDCLVLHAYLPFTHDYRHGRSFKDFPVAEIPSVRPRIRYVGVDGERAEAHPIFSPLLLRSGEFASVGEDFNPWAEILGAGLHEIRAVLSPMDRTFILAITDVVCSLFGDDALETAFPTLSYRCCYANLTAAALVLRSVPAFQAAVVKRWFDYNWNVNARMVFNLDPAFRDLRLSKYMLLALQVWKADGAPRSFGEFVLSLEKHEGTGKYGIAQIGSPLSQGPIWASLLAQGLLEEAGMPHPRKGGLYRLSQKAHAFLGSLHPDCEDLDLPARLERWMEEGFESSKPKMERYIKTFFGKQIRFARRGTTD